MYDDDPIGPRPVMQIAEDAQIGRVPGTAFGIVRLASGAKVGDVSLGDLSQEAREYEDDLRGSMIIGERATVGDIYWKIVDPEEGVCLTVGPGTHIGDTRMRGVVKVGARCQINANDADQMTATLWGAVIGDDCRIDGPFQLEGVLIGDDAQIVSRAEIERSTLGAKARLLNDWGVTIEDSSVGAGFTATEAPTSRATARGATLHGVTQLYYAQVGRDVTVGFGTLINRHAKIADRATIGARCEVSPRVEIGSDVTIGDDVRIGQDSRIGTYAVIGEGVEIGEYVTIDPYVSVGGGARIAAGVHVDSNVAAGAQLRRAGATRSEQRVLHATSESWLLGRLADIVEESGLGRLDKRAIQKAHPQLVEHALVKRLLQISKQQSRATIRGEEVEVSAPVTAEQLRELSRQFAGTAKYQMTLVLEGWRGIQRITPRVDDVMLFDLDEEVAMSFATDDDERMLEHKRLCVRTMMRLGRPPRSAHPGADRPLNAGWARFVHFDRDKAILIEELQTDLLMLSYNPGRDLSMATMATGGGRDYLPYVEAEYVVRGNVSDMLAAWLRLHPEHEHPDRREHEPKYRFRNANVREGLEGAFEDNAFSALSYISDNGAGASRIVDRDRSREVEFTPARDPWPAARLIAAMTAVNAGFGSPWFDWYVENGDRRKETLWPGRVTPEVFGPDGQIDPWVVTGLAANVLMYHGRRGWRGAVPDTVSDRLSKDEVRAANEAAQHMAEWLQDTAEQLISMMSDLYESMLAGMLIYAREVKAREVWLLDYDTKYAMAAYSRSFAPPRSVYTDLPKRFQVSAAQPLPEWMNPTEYADRRDQIAMAPWAQVKPPKEPRGRRLMPNRGTR